MRLIDADQLLDFIKFDEKVIAPEEHTAEDIVMMIQTAPTIAPTPNDPLTLEELRQMNGKRVWVECERSYGKVYVDGDRVSVSTFEAFYTRPEEYIMYRRRPEEE